MKQKQQTKVLADQSFVGPLAAAVLVAIIVGFTTDKFWDFNNLNNIAYSVSITALLAIGATLVIFIGGIDISSGSMIALTTMVMAEFVKMKGLPIGAGILIAIIIGSLLGAFNGFLTAYLRVPSFISTLAGSSIFKGIAYLFNGGSPIFSIAPDFDYFFYGKLFNLIPLPFLYVAVFYSIFAVFMKYTRQGREIYAVGGNESAARLSGINVKKVKMMTYVIAGTMSGFAAVLMASRLNSGSPNYGSGMEMAAIAAAVIGGASLAGGRGSIINTLLGALTIVIVQNGLNLNAVNTSLQSITLGAIILFAVLIDMWKVEFSQLIRKIGRKKNEK